MKQASPRVGEAFILGGSVMSCDLISLSFHFSAPFGPVCIQVEEEVFWQAIKAMDQTEDSLCGVPLMEDE